MVYPKRVVTFLSAAVVIEPRQQGLHLDLFRRDDNIPPHFHSSFFCLFWWVEVVSVEGQANMDVVSKI